jgi:methylglutaconyl-CoA hydratase
VTQPSDVVAPPVVYEATGAVATITLNQPELRNRLSPAAMAMTRELLERAVGDDAVRVVVLTGTGSTFCAGADLAAATAAAGGDSYVGSGPAELVRLLEAILDCPKVTIARIQGHVAAGGNGIVAACDLAIAVDEARFAFSEVRLGLAAAVISVPCFAVMNRRDAQELFLTGERVDAARVLRAGLVTAVVPADRLDAEVDRYCAMIALGGPQALRHTKELLRRVPSLPRDEAFAWTTGLSAALFASDEAREGMTAFLSKRAPGWAPA